MSGAADVENLHNLFINSRTDIFVDILGIVRGEKLLRRGALASAETLGDMCFGTFRRKYRNLLLFSGIAVGKRTHVVRHHIFSDIIMSARGRQFHKMRHKQKA